MMPEPLIVADPDDPGFFELGSVFLEDPTDPGFYILLTDSVHEDPTDPGFYSEIDRTPILWTPTPTIEETLQGHRTVSYTAELVNRTGGHIANLDGVTGGSLEWSATASVKGGGSLNWVAAMDVDWARVRVKITATVGEYSWGLGVWLPAVPVMKYNDSGASATIEVLSREAVLNRHGIAAAYSLPAGAIVTDVVRELIALSGEGGGASITDSAAALAAPMFWPAGTSLLRIINDVLDAAGFFSLWSDGDGQFRVEPYVRPNARPLAWEFIDGPTAIYAPGFSRALDVYSVPNTVVASSRATGDEEALVAVAVNDDPASPFSTVNVGVITHTESDVEVIDEAVLIAYAQRRLAELTSATATVEVSHAAVPLVVNAAVGFASTPAGVNGRHVVTRTAINLDPLALAASTFREVVGDG